MNQTNIKQTTTELKQEFKRSLDLLRTLRDEVRLSLHLGGMEAKDQWEKLETRLEAIEQGAHNASESVRVAVDAATHELKKFRDALKPGQGQAAEAPCCGSTHKS